MTLLDQLRAEMVAATRAQERELYEAIFNPKHEQLSTMAKVSLPTFGDILNPTPDPIAGLKSLFK